MIIRASQSTELKLSRQEKRKKGLFKKIEISWTSPKGGHTGLQCLQTYTKLRYMYVCVCVFVPLSLSSENAVAVHVLVYSAVFTLHAIGRSVITHS